MFGAGNRLIRLGLNGSNSVNLNLIKSKATNFRINAQPTKMTIRNSASSSSNAASTGHQANKMEGSLHWYFEKALSLALVPLLAVSATVGSVPFVDYSLGVVVPVHIHMGLSSVIMDYLPFRRTPIAFCLAVIGQHVATFYSLFGCYIINSKDVGLTEYTKKLWKA